MTAGQNEKRFIHLFSKRFGKGILLGKKVFKNLDTVQISVDNSFTDKKHNYLIEIDSGNMAKLLVGQYTLLNELYTGDKEDCTFIIIHTYKKYNPERTRKNLNLINTAVYKGNGIRFYAMHINDLENWRKWKNKSLKDFISQIQT